MIHDHLVDHIHNKQLDNDNTLHVIGVLTNYVRWHSRYRLARKWIAEMLATPNVKLYLVEAAYKDRKFEITDAHNPHHLQVRTGSEIWIKENLATLAFDRLLPKGWKNAAWVDMDIHFRNPNWAQEALHQLQHYDIIQPWSHAVDLDAYGGIHGSYTSFGYLCANNLPMHHGKGKVGYTYAHSGFAWACTRHFYENIRELIQFCIVGAGDHHMAWGCLGKIRETIHKGMCPEYYEMCDEWQRKATRACNKLVGYSHGRIEHMFHGPKERRQYWNRWEILERNKFNPKTDLCYDSQGVLQLCGTNKVSLEHDIMRYNRQRIEDSIEQY
jgi:hypothetical protein